MTEKGHGLRVERLVDAPRERVFRAWTDRDELRQWFHFDDDWQIVDVQVDLRAGGAFRITWKAPDGMLWHEFGEYREVTQPVRLVHTCQFDFPEFDEDETVVTIEFHERGTQTLIVIEQQGYREAEHRDMHQQGWPGFLDQLDKLLTRGNA